ncbi:MAG: GNAT family N-acetyltransferase [Sphingobacteriia bacterium]|nr:GNAT family N-acetyltransferase [Sphingobacteriia bacterium]
MLDITFRKPTLDDKEIIFSWLDKPHVHEFWDNSIDHRNDINNFLEGRVTPSNYFNGIFTYWMGLINNEPFSFLLTSEIIINEDISEVWKNHMSKSGKTITIDFCIGNEKFLGKKLASPTLEAFTKFYYEEVDEKANTFFIDPDENNPKAKHVYKKAGFKEVANFAFEKGVFEGNKASLMMKKLS